MVRFLARHSPFGAASRACPPRRLARRRPWPPPPIPVRPRPSRLWTAPRPAPPLRVQTPAVFGSLSTASVPPFGGPAASPAAARRRRPCRAPGTPWPACASARPPLGAPPPSRGVRAGPPSVRPPPAGLARALRGALRPPRGGAAAAGAPAALRPGSPWPSGCGPRPGSPCRRCAGAHLHPPPAPPAGASPRSVALRTLAAAARRRVGPAGVSAIRLCLIPAPPPWLCRARSGRPSVAAPAPALVGALPPHFPLSASLPAGPGRLASLRPRRRPAAALRRRRPGLGRPAPAPPPAPAPCPAPGPPPRPSHGRPAGPVPRRLATPCSFRWLLGLSGVRRVALGPRRRSLPAPGCVLLGPSSWHARLVAGVSGLALSAPRSAFPRAARHAWGRCSPPAVSPGPPARSSCLRLRLCPARPSLALPWRRAQAASALGAPGRIPVRFAGRARVWRSAAPGPRGPGPPPAFRPSVRLGPRGLAALALPLRFRLPPPSSPARLPPGPLRRLAAGTARWPVRRAARPLPLVPVWAPRPAARSPCLARRSPSAGFPPRVRRLAWPPARPAPFCCAASAPRPSPASPSWPRRARRGCAPAWSPGRPFST